MSYDVATAILGCEKSAAAYEYPTFTPQNAKFILETVNDTQLLTFAGTCNPEDVCEDLEAFTVPRDGCGRLCMGDADYWDACRDIVLAHLDKSLPARCFGHSLGGSVANIASLVLKNHGFTVLDPYTYGAKRSGDGAWKTALDASGLVPQRFAVRRDPVPDAESWLPHVGEEIAMGESGLPLLRFHSIEKSYLPLINRL